MANPPFDQWGNPLPNNAGPKRINVSDGTSIPIRSNLKLTSDFTVTDLPDTDETALNVAGTPATAMDGLSGDVTAAGPGVAVATIGAGKVTLAMQANLAQDQFIGRTTASTGVPETATITAAARTVLDDTTTGAMVTTLGAQPVDADLTAIAALTSAADKVPYSTGAQAWALADFTAAARTWVAAASATAMTAILDVATTGLRGLMSAADKVKLDAEEVLIDSQTLTAAASYASPTWASGLYRKIRIEARFSLFRHIRMTYNGFAATTGRTAGIRALATTFLDANDTYLHYSGDGQDETSGVLRAEFYPLVVTDAGRGGMAECVAVDAATGLVPAYSRFGFVNSDLTTAILGFALEFVSTNATGSIKVYGTPA